jgi:hypothetical protein
LSEHKPIAKPEQVKKSSSGSEVKEGSTSSQSHSHGIGPGEMAFASLQSAADTSTRSSGIAQLQNKANQSNSIFQLQAKADARSTRQVESIQNQGNTTPTTQLKGEMSSSGDHEFEQMGDGLGAKTVQLAKAETPAAAPNKPDDTTAVVQLEKGDEPGFFSRAYSAGKRLLGFGQSKVKTKKNDVQSAATKDNDVPAVAPIKNEVKPVETTAPAANEKTEAEKFNLVQFQNEINAIQEKINGFNSLLSDHFLRKSKLENIQENKSKWELLVKQKGEIKELQKSFGEEQKKIPTGRKRLIIKSGKGEFPKLLEKDYSTLWEKDYQEVEDSHTNLIAVEKSPYWIYPEKISNNLESVNLLKKESNEFFARLKTTDSARVNRAEKDKTAFEVILARLENLKGQIQPLEVEVMSSMAELDTNSKKIKDAPPLSLENLKSEFQKLQKFVEKDYENWKKEKEEFKRLDEKSKAWFSSGLTEEEKGKLNSYRKDVFLNVSSDEISEGDIKTSLGSMSSFSSKSKERENSTNNEDKNSSKNENSSEREKLEEQIKLKKEEVKKNSSWIPGRGAKKESSELAELETKLKELIEKGRFESLSKEDQDIELKRKEVKEKSSWIPGMGAKKERAELANLEKQKNEKEEEERFNKLSPSKQAIELKQKDIKDKSSWFLGLGAKTEKAELANLLAKEKDEQERAQYNSLKELIYSPEENAAKQFIAKTEDILNLDWKSLEDKEKYYQLIKTENTGIIDKAKPDDRKSGGLSDQAKTSKNKANIEKGEALINGPEKSKATDSDSKKILVGGQEIDEKEVQELVKEESEFYTPIVLELYSIYSIVDDLKKIKEGKMELNAAEQAILTKKFATAAMNGMQISDNLLNHTAISFAQIVPGLGLFIHIATAAATFFTKLMAVTSKEAMHEYSKNFDGLKLENELVFEDDERGALLVKRNFRKVKPKFLEEADTYLEKDSEKIEDFNKKYGLKFKNNAELKEYVGQVQTREMIVKLHEINLKREVHANWNMASELAIVSGDISNMIAGGQLVAGLFYGFGGGLKLFKKAAVAVNKANNGEENAFNPFGEDGMKHKEYVIHSKQIISMYSKNIDLLSPKNEEDKKKLSVNVNVAEKVVVAAGAFPPAVYKEAGKDKKGYKAVNKLVSAMKKGRS